MSRRGQHAQRNFAERDGPDTPPREARKSTLTVLIPVGAEWRDKPDDFVIRSTEREGQPQHQLRHELSGAFESEAQVLLNCYTDVHHAFCANAKDVPYAYCVLVL